MNYQSFLVTIGVLLLVGMMFYYRAYKDSKLERIVNKIRKRKKGKRKIKTNFSSDIYDDAFISLLDIIDKQFMNYEVLEHSYNSRSGIITLKLKRRKK